MRRTSLVVIAAGLAMACGLPVSGPAQAALPAVGRLFGCPLATAHEAFDTPKDWVTRRLRSIGARASAPEGWRVEVDGAIAVLASPDGAISLALRRGRLVGPDRLDFVRRSVELTELGPSHAGPLCEAAVVAAVMSVSGWRDVRFGVHARPLGERRRSWSLFLGLPQGSLTAVVTVRWSARAAGPDITAVRRLLGSIRPL